MNVRAPARVSPASTVAFGVNRGAVDRCGARPVNSLLPVISTTCAPPPLALKTIASTERQC